MSEQDSPYTMLPTSAPFGFAARSVAANFRAYLASTASQPHRCIVRRKSHGRWTWECRESECGGDDWLISQHAAFAAAFGHASGWTGPYPYRPSPWPDPLLTDWPA